MPSSLLDFGNRLRQLRTDRKLTQSDIANLIEGVTQSHYSKYELGKVWPGSEITIAFANFFGVTTDWLLKGTGPGPDHSGLIPVYDCIPAGTELLDPQLTESFIELPPGIEADFACSVPDYKIKIIGIAKGDLAFFRKTATVQEGQIIAAHQTKEPGEITLHFFAQKNGQAFLRPANPDDKTILLTTHQIDGVLTALLKTAVPSLTDYEEFLHYQEKLNESWSDIITLTTDSGIPVSFVKQLVEQQIKMSKKISKE